MNELENRDVVPEMEFRRRDSQESQNTNRASENDSLAPYMRKTSW